jgi:hypothetical protein
MEGLCKFYKDRGPIHVELSYNDCEGNVEVSDVDFSDSQEATATKHLKFHGAEPLTSWLKTLNERPAFLIAWIPTAESTWDCQLPKATLDLIVDHFQIRTAFNSTLTASSLIADFPGEGVKNEAVNTYSIAIGDVAIASWFHDSAANVTKAICISDTWTVEDMQSLPKYQDDLIGHPMAIAYFTAMSLGVHIDRSSQEALLSIGEVERRTGHHIWGNFDGDVAKGDFSTLSAKMTGCASQLAMVKRSARFLHEILSFAAEHSEMLEDDPRSRKLSQASDKCQKALQRRLTMQEIYAEYLLQRTQNQLTAVSSSAREAFSLCWSI